MTKLKTKTAVWVLGFLAMGMFFVSVNAFATKPSSKVLERRFMNPQGMRKDAFSALPDTFMPMAPEQIKLLKKFYNKTQQAAAASGGTPPKPTSSSLLVDLSPGATPPIIRLAKGFVTTLVFLDGTGAPWPILAYDNGDPEAFKFNWMHQRLDYLKKGMNSGNTLLVQSRSLYRQGNLAVMLNGLDTPVMITLISDQNAVDYRVDVHVPRKGPLAKPNVNTLPAASSTFLLDIINNVVPKSAILTTSRSDVQAWMIGQEMYVRTPLTIISPSWVSKMSSSSGSMHAYKLSPTPVVLILDNGRILKVNIKGF
jgi:intracellular multiplication protein IcmK